MNVQDMLNQFLLAVPRVVGAIVVFIIGWIIALIVSSAVRTVIRRTGLDRRIATMVVGRERAATVDVAQPASRAVYYLILLFVILAVLQALELTLVTAPIALLLSTILGFIPSLIGAALLFLLAWVVATIVRAVVLQFLRAIRIDERLRQSGGPSLATTLSEVAYYLVFLFFLPGILGALRLTGILAPVQLLLNTILGFLPRLVSAALILIVGIFVAGLVRRIVTDLLAAAGADRLGARLGMGGQPQARPGATAATPATTAQPVGLSATLGWIVYALILLPVITASLDALQLAAVTQPISNMLNLMLGALPNIFAAAVLLVLAYAVSRVVGGLVATILAGLGFDAIPARLGFGAAPAAGQRGLSAMAGNLTQVAIMLFASIAALNLLGFAQVSQLVTAFVYLAGRILLGVIIFALGLYLARWAAGMVMASGTPNAGLLAGLTRAAVLVLSGAIALREMGIADEIINLAFGLLLGSVAVAAAIAFGIGGREVARQELERFARSARTAPPTTPMAPPAPPIPPQGGLGQSTTGGE